MVAERIDVVPRRGGFRKVDSKKWESKICRDPEHNPPSHISLKNGTYEYECPSCGAIRTIIVNNPTL